MSAPPATDLAAHTGRFVAMLDDAFRRFGELVGDAPAPGLTGCANTSE